MKKFTIWIFTILLLILVVFWRLESIKQQRSEINPNNKTVIKIGVSLPLSGELASIGNNIKDVILLAQKKLLTRNLKNNYQFIIEDDAFDSKKTISAFKKLKSIDNIDAMISFSSQSGGVVSPLAQQNKIAHINVGASNEEVSNGKYNFIHWTMPSETSKKMLDFYKKKKYKKIALITPYNSGSLAIYRAVENNLINYPNFELKTFKTQPEEKDYKILLYKVKSYKPDVILSLAYGNNAKIFLKQFFESGIKTPLTNIETFTTLSSYEGLDGIYLSSTEIIDREFLNEYQNKYPNNGLLAVGNTYDSVMLLVKAFENTSNKNNVIDKLREIKKYNGVMGKLNQKENGVFNSQTFIKTIKNGKEIIIEN